MKREKLYKYNSFAFILIFFLYSIVTFPGIFIGQGPATIAIALVTILPIIWINVKAGLSKQSSKAFGFELIVFLVLVIELLLFPQYIEGIIQIIVTFVALGTIGLLVATFQNIDIELCFKYGTYLSYIGLVSSMLMLAIPSLNLFDASMRFAYALLPSVLWYALMAIKDHSIKFVALFIITYIPLLIYGSRGATLVILIFLGLYLLKFNRKFLLVLIPILIIGMTPLLSILLDGLKYLEELTGAEKIGVMVEFVSGIGEGHEESRNIIWDHCINVMKEHPFGNGVSWWMYDSVIDYNYPHNIIIHLGTEFGIFGLCLFFIYCFVSLKVIFKSTGREALLFIYMFSITIGRLLVSSTFWDRPEFWFTVGIFFFRNTRLATNKRITT